MRLMIDHGTIYDMASDTATYNAGCLLAQNGAVSDKNFHKQGSLYVLSAKVTDGPAAYRVIIVIKQNGDMLSNHCGCNAAAVWNGACRHTVAFLHTLVGESRDKTKRVYEDKTAEKVVTGIKEMALRICADAFFAESPEPIRLKPEIHVERAHYSRRKPGIMMSFKVGSGRMYVVKNVKDFVNAVIDAETVTYGKSLSFKHSLGAFDEKSGRLCELLINWTQTADDLMAGVLNRYVHSAGNSREVTVTGAGFDDFFDIYKGDKVFVSAEMFSGELLFSEEPPPEHYTLSEKGGNPVLSLTETNEIGTIYGSAGNYIITENALYKQKPQATKIKQLLEYEMSRDRSRSLTFRGSNKELFFSYVLPLLKENSLADTSQLDEKFGIKELDAKVYLDASEGVVTAKLKFSYGDNESPNAYRNAAAEDAVILAVEQSGFVYNPDEDTYELREPEKIRLFYRSGADRLRDYFDAVSKAGVNIYATDDFTAKSRHISYKRAVFGVRLKGNLLEIAPSSSEFSMRELIEIADSYKAKKKFHLLKDGRIVDLDNENAAKDAEIIDSLYLSKKDVTEKGAFLPAGRAMYVNGIIEGNSAESGIEERYFDRDEAFGKIVGDFTGANAVGRTLPPSLESVLRGYQKEGFKWLSLLAGYGFGGILADDMGLGKTLQVISLILARKDEGETSPALVVAPTSLIFNWQHECKRFAPAINTYVISKSADKTGAAPGEDSDIDVYVTTYDLLKRDIEYFGAAEYSLIIADEAQNIKNPVTQNAKAVKKLNAAARFALTGTPIENSLSELWSILDFALPGFLFGYSKFHKEYEIPIAKQKDSAKTEQLKKLIAPFILRRVKKDVLSEIPDKLETTLYAQMTPAQRKLYAAYHLKARGELDIICDMNMQKENRVKVLTYLTRLRQICCHPGVFVDKYTGGSGKLSVVTETIRNCVDTGHRILLFSQFTSVLDILMPLLDAEEISYFYLDGATSAKQRLKMCERFNGGEREVFLISLKAGGTGLNLVGADVVIHFDPWWNPAVMDQATDRAHRIGQDSVVQVFSVVAKDTVEEKIMELQAQKRGLADSIITGGAGFINRLSSEELISLFS